MSPKSRLRAYIPQLKTGDFVEFPGGGN